MSSSKQVLGKITSSILEVAECIARADHYKYYDICSCFNFLWSIYQSEKEVEERTNINNWGGFQQEQFPQMDESHINWDGYPQNNSWGFWDDNGNLFV